MSFRLWSFTFQGQAPYLKLPNYNWFDSFWENLGSVPGPVIQAIGRLTFEDNLRSGGLLCFISMNASVPTELADSMGHTR